MSSKVLFMWVCEHVCVCTVYMWVGSTCLAWLDSVLKKDTPKNTSCLLQLSRKQHGEFSLQRAYNNLCHFLSLYILSRPHCLQSASIYSSSLLIREQKQKRPFSKERNSDSDCVLFFSGWKCTCHWFPFSLSLPLVTVSGLKRQREKISAQR